jgi:mono/diheme cytochrome c family protein
MREYFAKPFEPQIIGAAAAAVGAAGEAMEPPKAYAENCAACHGDKGEGGVFPKLLGVASKPQRTKDDLLKILENSRTYGLKAPMPESFPKLTPEEKEQIAKWMATLK